GCSGWPSGSGPAQPSSQRGASGSASRTTSRTIGSRSSWSPSRRYVSPSTGCASKISCTGPRIVPSTRRRHRRHSPVQPARTVPVTDTVASPIASSTTWASTSEPSTTCAELTARSPSGPLTSTARRVPGRRSRSATSTTNARPPPAAAECWCTSAPIGATSHQHSPGARLLILVEERLTAVIVLLGGDRRGLARRRQRVALQLRPAGRHGLQRPLQHDLEARELLVAVVLALQAQPARLVVSGVDGLPGAQFRGLHHLGALHHALGAGPSLVEDVVGVATGLRKEVLTLLQEPPRRAQLVGQSLDRLLEQLEHLLPVDHHRRRQRHRTCARDDVSDPPQQDLALGVLVVDPRGRRVGSCARHRAACRCRLVGACSFVVVHRHGCANRSRIRAATGSGTIDETSPPNRAMSRMNFDAIAELADAVGRKTV